MKYCNLCGGDLVHRVPPDDNRKRHVCTRCGYVHYQNPRIIAGSIPEWQGQVLLCKRAIEPRLGLWTLPAGYMELGETTAQAALRETLEEANARVEVSELYTVISLPHVDQVYMMYRARLLDLEFSPGAETEQVQLFAPDQIPWDRLAFGTVRHTLEFYLQDQERGEFVPRCGDLVRDAGGYRFRMGPLAAGA